MMRPTAIGVALALWASGAAAQTTHCAPTIDGMPSAGVTCRSTSAGMGQVYSWKDVPPKPCTTLQRMAEGSGPLCAAREVAANRKAVGDLIAAGKCDDALKGALSTGDLEFARDVRDFCGTK